MFSRSFFIVLAAAMMCMTGWAETPALPDAPSATKAKLQADLNRFAAAEKKVTVRLNNSEKVTGKVQDIGEESFAVTDTKSGQIKRVNFDDVASVKKAGMSTGTKVLIAVGVVAGVSLTMVGIQCATGALHC